MLLKAESICYQGGGVEYDGAIQKKAVEMKFQNCTFASISKRCFKEKQMSPNITGLIP